MKKPLALLLTLALALSLTSCGNNADSQSIEIFVFAAASMQESLNTAIEKYKTTVPHVTVTATYDSSGTLKTQIEEGAPCDLFISAAPKQMDALEASGFVVQGSCVDLLENKVTLAVPAGNPADIKSFGQLADLLKNGEVMLAMGNSDVPVGQYTQKLFAYYGIDEAAVSDKLTYGSNAKEVAMQVAEGAVDCGIIYGTDAHSAGLTVVDSATAEMCGQVIYPAAVITAGKEPPTAQEFLNFLSSPEAKACFEAVGFSPLA